METLPTPTERLFAELSKLCIYRENLTVTVFRPQYQCPISTESSKPTLLKQTDYIVSYWRLHLMNGIFMSFIQNLHVAFLFRSSIVIE